MLRKVYYERTCEVMRCRRGSPEDEEEDDEEGREGVFGLMGLGDGAKLKLSKLSSQDAFLYRPPEVAAVAAVAAVVVVWV